MSVISPFKPIGPAATLSRRVNDQVLPDRSARNTCPRVVPMNKRVRDANASAKAAPPAAPPGRVKSAAQEVAKFVDTKMRSPAPTATRLASARLAGSRGRPTIGWVMLAQPKSQTGDQPDCPPVVDR
jgi:hypothetical protein